MGFKTLYKTRKINT